MLLCELVELFARYNRHNRCQRTTEFYAAELAKVVKLYGQLPATDLRPFHLLELKTSWHLCLSVQRLYRWATDEQGLLESNPMKKLRRPRLGARRRVLCPQELLRILRGARADFRRYLFFARESAARPQELRELSWDDLRWEGAESDLEGALMRGEAYFLMTEFKGRARRADASAVRIIPISPRLGRMLARLLRTRSRTGQVLTTQRGQAWNRNSLRMRLKRVLQRVDVPHLAHGERVVCYTLRHSAATSMAARGMQTSVLQGLLGHAKIATTGRYIHLHRQQLMKTWAEFWEKRRRGPNGKT